MGTFINLSEASTIAIHSLALIANSKVSMNANKISEITHFSKNHLAKVLNILVRHNYLDSVRGPKGGFTLKINPAEISLMDIYSLIEGDFKQFQCTVTCIDCYFDTCLFGEYPHKFAGDFQNYLKNKTLSEVHLNREI